WKLDPEEWYSTQARRIIHIQRAALLLGGPDVRWRPWIDDVNPPRFYEPLPTGPWRGKAPKRSEVEEAVKRYYNEVGWDERGIPKSEELRRLGLESVDKKLEEIR
ncbi:aldehyde ferredoxin oxidoreductase, partial [Candidatus Bathyarchaeota archaeon]